MTDEYRKKLKTYYFKCFLMEGSKILLFSILFAILHLTKEYLIALFFLIGLRTNGGGLHCKKYSSCFLLSLGILALNIHLANVIYFPTTVSLICLLICLCLCVALVPITSKNRPKASAEVIKRSKFRTGLFITTFSILYYMFPSNIFLSSGFWAIILHTIQLLIAKILERRDAHV